jgi:ribose transport system substrate-binding protein
VTGHSWARWGVHGRAAVGTSKARRRVAYLAVAAPVVAMSLMASACSSSGTSTGTANPASTNSTASSANVAKAQAALAKWLKPPTPIMQTTPLPHKPSPGKIVFIYNNLPDTIQETQGTEAAAKAVGWQYSQVLFDSNNPATLQAAFQTALTKKPTVVVTIGTPPSQFGASVIATYTKAGVPIVAASTWPVQTTNTILGIANGNGNSIQSGTVLGDWFVADSNGSGQALFVNAPIFPILNGVYDSFQSTTQALCSACKISTLTASLPEIASGGLDAAVVAYLQSHQSIKYVFFDLGTFADGITTALNAAGITDVKVAGYAMDPEGAAAIRAGTEAAWTGQSYYYVGYAIMDVALRHEEGVSTAGDDVTPTQLLTKDNIGTISNWNQPTDSLAQFEKLWKVPITPCSLGCSGG